MRILELRPLVSPIAPKSDGWLASVVDHATRDELVEKYRADPNVDTSCIADVDIVWSGAPLNDAIPSELHGTYDAFIASHVFEHIPDPIGLLALVGAGSATHRRHLARCSRQAVLLRLLQAPLLGQ